MTTRQGTTNVRMYLSTLKRFYKILPPIKGESAAVYFERLSIGLLKGTILDERGFELE